MDPLPVLQVLGALLIIGGIVAVFKVQSTKDSKIKLPFGVDITTPVPGLALALLGVVMVYVPTTDFLKQEPTITGVSLMTDDGYPSGQYNVRCPFSVGLTGEISVGIKGGVVSYRFVHSQGIGGTEVADRVQQLNFSEPDTKTVSTSVDFTFPAGETTVMYWLEVLEPGQEKSDSVRLDMRCDLSLPPGPDTLPPDVGTPAP